MNEQQKQQVIKILQNNEFGVICTNSYDRVAPESAVVAISNTEDLQIIFGTFQDSRKFKNLQRDRNVSIVVGWDNDKKQTMQIEGVAEIVSEELRPKIEDIHCLKNKASEKFRGNLQQAYFLVKPYWIRFSDFSKHPQEIWEIDLEI